MNLEYEKDRADLLFKDGKLREAITKYRDVLRFEHDRFVRAQIYIKLVHIYRLQMRMKNARLEIQRAFAEIQLRLPENSLISVMRSLIQLIGLEPELHPDFQKRDSQSQIELLAQLFEELGLSAYYLRQNLLMYQSSLIAKKICHRLGPSMPLLNWYGGSACVWSLLGFQNYGVRLMKRCHEISHQINDSKSIGKVMIWKALLYDYVGIPLKAVPLLEDCIRIHGADLEPYDLQLAAVALSTNYMARGHNEDAIRCVRLMGDLNPCFREIQSIEQMDTISWYTLAPSVMVNKKTNIEQNILNFKSILSSDKDEKWILTRFIGHLMIVIRKVPTVNLLVDDVINRFKVLKISPKETHFEAAFYWVAEAYHRLDQAVLKKSSIMDFKLSLKQLKRTPDHPTNKSHYLVLRSGLAALEKKQDEFMKFSLLAEAKSKEVSNLWALEELKVIKERFYAESSCRTSR